MHCRVPEGPSILEQQQRQRPWDQSERKQQARSWGSINNGGEAQVAPPPTSLLMVAGSLPCSPHSSSPYLLENIKPEPPAVVKQKQLQSLESQVSHLPSLPLDQERPGEPVAVTDKESLCVIKLAVKLSIWIGVVGRALPFPPSR